MSSRHSITNPLIKNAIIKQTEIIVGFTINCIYYKSQRKLFCLNTGIELTFETFYVLYVIYGTSFNFFFFYQKSYISENVLYVNVTIFH